MVKNLKKNIFKSKNRNLTKSKKSNKNNAIKVRPRYLILNIKNVFNLLLLVFIKIANFFIILI